MKQLSESNFDVTYIRDPGALTREDPFNGMWQGRLITPDLMGPETLRYAASRSQVFNNIIRYFQREVSRFARRPMFDGDVGFSVVPKIRQHHMTPDEEKEARRIEDYLLITGAYYNPDRTDTLRDYLIKQVYNRYVFDRMVTQLTWGTVSPLEFKALDGSTILLADPARYEPQTERGQAVAPIKYLQLHRDAIWAEFNASEIVWGVCNQSPLLMQNGYGYPEIMDLMGPITTEILIETYVQRMLTQGSIPEGLLVLKSPRRGQEIESLSLASGQTNEDFARMIKMQVAGTENAGRLAVLRLRGGEEAEMIMTDRHLDKMPFIQALEIAQNQIARKLGVDPAEVAVVQGSLKSSFSDSDQKASKLRQSRSRAVTNLLYDIADTQLNPIIERLNPNFCIRWHGIDAQLEQEKLNLEKMQQTMGLLTLNDLIAHQNGKKYPNDDEHWWANVPLHDTIFKAIAAERGISLSGGGGKGGDGGIGGRNDNTLAEEQGEMDE